MDELFAIRQLSNGCKKSFQFLYDNYNQKVFKVAFSLGMRNAEAVELVQDVFIILWTKRKLLVNVNSFEAYLIAITKNLSYKMIRKKAFEHAHKTYFTDEHFLIVEPDLDIEKEEIKNISRLAFNKLSAKQKEIFNLFTQENLSQQQIAEQLSLSVRTVEHQIYRAKKKIKQFLKMGLMLFVYIWL